MNIHTPTDAPRRGRFAVFAAASSFSSFPEDVTKRAAGQARGALRIARERRQAAISSGTAVEVSDAARTTAAMRSMSASARLG